ncbi:hypothetical protein BT63DRAFT_417339 [Microthyrium microscopicum]|uniref:Rhodopsin domain-containing protein n=1 Tax=Microthyrium microscopicum TaxID=703497 RepID=A0A6A6U4D9_9PEZI|nr:hypothetical protein BT63DRAFT_417339 [Microthyrium microscopicum]
MGVFKPTPSDVLIHWPKPNYVNPVTRGPELLIVTATFLGISTIVVFCRLYARLVIRRWLGLDDVLIFLAWMASVGVTSAVDYGFTHVGWDKHIWDLTIPNYMDSGKPLFASCFCWAVSSSCVRLSLLSFYFRLAEHIQMGYRWILYTVIGVSVLFLVAYLLPLIFMCIPLQALWKYPPDPNAKCLDLGAFMLSMSIINTVLELIVAILPIPAIFILDMDPRQRYSVIGLLSLGFFVFAVGCVRCYYVYASLLGTWDITWQAYPHWICSEIEINLALVCACAPALRPVLGRLFSARPIKPKDTSTTLVNSIPTITLRPKEGATYSVGASLVWFDLEGIADDGLGYTVSITANGKHLASRHRSTRSIIRKSFQKDPSTLLNTYSASDIHSQNSMELESTAGIVERLSLEITETFQGKTENMTWKTASEEGDWVDLRTVKVPLKKNLAAKPESSLSNDDTIKVSSEEPEGHSKFGLSTPKPP